MCVAINDEIQLDLLLGYIVMCGGIDHISRTKMWKYMFARIALENKLSGVVREITDSKRGDHKPLIKFCRFVVPYLEQSSYLLNMAVTNAFKKGNVLTVF
jgi:hypothetical protein